MTELLLFRDKIKSLYGKYDVYIDPVLKFVATLVAVLVINGMTGYNKTASSPLVVILISAVGAFVAGGITTLICCALVVFQLYKMSIEFAVITGLVILIMLFVYYVFSPRTSYVMLLVPVLYAIKLPYLAPIIIGLTVGVPGVVPAAFGTYLYYALTFSKEFKLMLPSFGENDFIQKLTVVIDNTIRNQEMMVMCIIFTTIIILVAVLRRMSFDYSFSIAIVVGSIFETIIFIISHVMLKIDFSVAGLLIGLVLTIIVGVILQFFIFSVDYQKTERVQFEDEDYYYYVKAVPKVVIAKTDVKVKKINTRTDVTETEEE